MTDDILLIIQFVAFLSVQLIQVYLLCYYGDLLTEKSISIGTMAYYSEWYMCKKADMKTIFLLILRAQEPCYISIYKFAVIKRETFKEVKASTQRYWM